jgi:integrase
MSAVAAAVLRGGPGQGREFPGVLAGVLLDGEAAGLAAAIDPAFLEEAGWDPVRRMLDLPARHPLLGRALCKVSGCGSAARPGQAGVCQRCFTRLEKQGMTAGHIERAAHLPAAPARTARCAVPGCGRGPGAAAWVLCRPHDRQCRRMQSPPLEQFLADPEVRPHEPVPECAVAVCSHAGEQARGYCDVHYRRWRAAVKADPGLDARQWEDAAEPAGRGGLVSMHMLPPLVTVQVLSGLQHRTFSGARTQATRLRAACRALTLQQVTSTGECDIQAVAGADIRHLLRVMGRYARRAAASPASEQARDAWDLAVFGHGGSVDFTGITQPWLRQCVKQWAAHDLPRRRGGGYRRVRDVARSAVRLSESLRARSDRGNQPEALSRRDAENFLARLSYLESAGTISREQRNRLCTDARIVLAAIRELGLAGSGQPAAGLPGDVALTPADIPALPERGEPGRDLPPEIMTALCAALDTLHPDKFRVAVQIAIETGRRPDEIVSLPLDCLTRDADGAPVLVYANIKAHRDGRRLPVSEHIASVITAQQEQVTAWFPATPRSDLKLLPSAQRNPCGRRHISISGLENLHRAWIAGLGTLRTGDGVIFDSARIVLYAYRHTYAQRHADAGVPIDVLAQLMDHKNLDVTRGYYRVGEDRRRAAVDKVTAMSFDRHGNRTWRDALALLDDGHARYAIGQVAVPYGTCTEPSNVAAGGGSCPVRFRCAGCDHFRTDVSYLPDLTGYLDDLLRTRERLAAMAGVDGWARTAAAPPQEEITRIRQLIGRIQGDIAQLSDSERAEIEDAVSAVRKRRAVHLGMPAVRTTAQEEPA